MKSQKKYSPQTAKTNNALCSLRRDNTGCLDFWIMVEEEFVHLAKQKLGEAPSAQMTIPKVAFNKFVRFYTTPTRS